MKWSELEGFVALPLPPIESPRDNMERENSKYTVSKVINDRILSYFKIRRDSAWLGSGG